MRLAVLALLVASAPAASAAPAAAPRAQLVVYWAPVGTDPALGAAVAAAAADAGATFVDRSPLPVPAPDVAALVSAGRQAYDDLRFDEAVTTLDRAALGLDHTGGAGLPRATLLELFLYRALARIQTGDERRAWDDLVQAARLDPHHVLDPARFPTRAVDALTRAQATVSSGARGRLAVSGGERCALTVDGVATTAPVELTAGAHWLAAACADRPDWGQRVEVRGDTRVVAPAPRPPGDDASLIQLRAVGGAALLAVDVHGAVAALRTVSVDGRERERASAGVAPTELAAAVAAQLAPAATPGPRRPWYRSRWAWAAAGAAVATAILVPVIALDDAQPGPRVLRPSGLPPW